MTTVEEIWARSFSSDRLSLNDDVRRRFAYYLLDTLSVMLAGAREPSVRAVADVVRGNRGSGGATVLGADFLAAPWDAAFVNATAAHVLELDDDHRLAVLHPGAVIVPAALAAAEDAGSSGSCLAGGLAAGYELTCRLGQLDEGNLFRRGFHPSSVFGTVGAALAVSVVLGLPPPKIVHALGIAASQANGLTCWGDGNWAKPLNLARAANIGVTAAYLAKEGFRGPAQGVTGKGGLMETFIGEGSDPERLVHRLGEEYVGVGTAVKFYPCCRFAHGAIDLAINASNEVACDDVERIEVDIFDTTVLRLSGVPASSTDAAFNVPFLVSQAFLCGRLGLEELRTAEHPDDTQHSLMCRTFARVAPDHTSSFPEVYLTTLTFLGRDGSILWQRTSRIPLGDPDHERYRTDGVFECDVARKAFNLLEESADEIDSERTIEAVLDFERNEIISLSGLIHWKTRR